MSADKPTIDFYRANAAEMASLYATAEHKEAHEMLRQLIAPGQRVVDIGCASGHDVAFLADQIGADVEGVDAVPEFIQIAQETYPHLASRFRLDILPALATCENEAYDVIVLWAVLMHLDEAQLIASLMRVAELLKPNALVSIRIPLAGRAVDNEHRDEGTARLYTPVSESIVTATLAASGLKLSSKSEAKDALGRAELSWLDLIYRRENC